MEKIDTKILEDHFSADDIAFIEQMAARHPCVCENFIRYAKLDPETRVETAEMDIRALPRTGWVRRAIENPESVFDHTERLARWVETLDLPTGTNIQHMINMARMHDIPESIVRDFPPEAKISKDEKGRLELLAARLLFSQHPERLALVQEYIDQKTEESRLLHDLDKLEAVRQALAYEGYHPEKLGKLYPEFRDYTIPRLKTDTGRNLAAELEATADIIRTDARSEYLSAQAVAR